MVEPIRLDYAANDAEVIAAFKRQQAEMERERGAREKLQKQINDNAKTQKEADRQQAEGQREAQRVIERTQTVQQKYAAEVAKIETLHKKGHLTLEQYNQAIAHEKKTLDGSAKSADAFGGALSGMAGKLTAVIGGFASMQSLIGLIRSEYDALLERQGKSSDATISLAAEQEALLMNIGNEDSQQIVDRITQLSKKRGVKQENVTRAVNEAMAARGDFAVGDIIDAVGSASKIRKFAPTELAGLASATVDVRKQTGLGTDESLGFLLQLQAQSRTKSLKELSANFTPAVGGLMQMGADRQTAGALLASLSHGMGDTSGAQTKTASLQLASQLREFGGGAPLAQVIQNLQNNAGLRNRFLSTMSSEVAARPAIESLLSGGNVARQFSATSMALQANPLDALAQAEKARSLTAMNIAEADSKLATGANNLLLSDPSAALSSVIRNRLNEIQKSTGGLAISADLQSVADDLMTGGVQGLDLAEKRLGELAKSERDKEKVGWDMGYFYRDEKRTAETDRKFEESFPSTQRGRNAALLLELVEQIKGMRDDANKAAQRQQQGAHAGVVAARGNNQNEGAPR